jgi:hypothetical protein
MTNPLRVCHGAAPELHHNHGGSIVKSALKYNEAVLKRKRTDTDGKNSAWHPFSKNINREVEEVEEGRGRKRKTTANQRFEDTEEKLRGSPW